jgi:DNA-binding response OmpR family regulator
MTAILVADASQTVRMDLADTFEAAGFRVFSCATVAEARMALRAQPIALAVIDPVLEREGESGLALLDQIRGEQVLRDLPVLLLANARDLGDKPPVTAANCVGKPYDRAQVIARARELVGAPPVRDSILVIANGASPELMTALSHAGFAVTLAGCGVDGLEAASASRPTAILIGTTPDLDRAAIIRRLRLTTGLRSTPCLALGVPADEVRALEAGADGFVTDDPELVLARIHALLRSSSASHLEGALPRVLAVDDDPDYLDVLASRLRKRGFDVLRASSGEQAVELLSGAAVDCILLDRSMPGMSGVETCQHLKANSRTRDTPIIFLTATDHRDAIIEGLACGADDFVSKASGFDALAARLQAQLRRRLSEAEQRNAREQVLRSELAIFEVRTARELADARAMMAEELARVNRELLAANRELEAFGYAVAHDLRAPLRTIGMAVHSIAAGLTDERSLDHVRRILAATSRMSDLIDSLLELGHVQGGGVGRHSVDLTALAASVVDDLSRRDPERCVKHAIADELVVDADGRLVRMLLDNLLDNAWKYTTAQPVAHVEVGVEHSSGERVFYVKDDGIGFDMAHASKLFTAGIGLQTARRIVERHGGRIWAEGVLGGGAKFSFTLQ